jgi:Rrf2 family protein
MLSCTAEYCLRAVVCLAGNHAQPLTSHQIAGATQIPPSYLCKVLHALSRAGLLSARRGLNGGFSLARDPASLTLLEVVRVVDSSQRVTTCPLGIHGQTLCPLHRQLDEAALTAEGVLASRTIAQLMATPGDDRCAAIHKPLAGRALTGDIKCLK